MKKIIIHTRDEAIQYAKDWQAWASDQDLSYGEMAEWQGYFSNIAQRLDLREEFEENGII